MIDIKTIKNSILVCGTVLLLVPVLISCRKDVAKGQQIEASGFVIDSVKIKKLPGVSIYLYGAHQSFYGINYDIGPLDSTVSDGNGNFSIKYTALGHSIDYALSIYPGNAIFPYPVNYIADADHPIYPFYYHNRVYNVELRARELNYVRLNLKVLSNPYDTLYLLVSATNEAFYLRYSLFGSSIDTSILTRCVPNSLNSFEYQIQTIFLQDSGISQRSMTDTLMPNLIDTLVVNKIINSTYDLPATPN